MHPDNAGHAAMTGEDQSYSDDASLQGRSETSNLCMEQCQIGEESKGSGLIRSRHTLG